MAQWVSSSPRTHMWKGTTEFTNCPLSTTRTVCSTCLPPNKEIMFVAIETRIHTLYGYHLKVYISLLSSVSTRFYT